MRRILQGAALLATAVFVLPLLAQDKQPEKKDPEPKKESLYKSAGQPITGKLVHYDESKKQIKLKVENKVIDQNVANQIQQIQVNLARAQGDLQRATNVNARNDAARRVQQHTNEINQHLPKLYKIEWKDAEVAALDDVKIRLTNPPVKFNEKGDIVKPTKQELEEMKGPDKNLPGYTGEASDLKTDRMVTVTLVVLKEIPAEIKKKKPDELTPDEKAMLQPKASVILVIEPQQGGPGGVPGPGK
jgi:hypothetical protein